MHTDATRRDSLEEERVGSADVFVACTGEDENNIMAAVEARDIGTKTVMALVSRPDYAHVVGKLGIDVTREPAGSGRQADPRLLERWSRDFANLAGRWRHQCARNRSARRGSDYGKSSWRISACPCDA